jgi:hypothetical protein
MKTATGLLDLGVEKYGFQHAIGDCVRLRVGGTVSVDWPGDRNVRWMVNGQHLEICSGGTQRAYGLSGVMRGGHTLNPAAHSRVFHEHELEACEPFPCEEEDKTSDETPN